MFLEFMDGGYFSYETLFEDQIKRLGTKEYLRENSLLKVQTNPAI